MYNAYITKLKNVRKHPNADRLQLAECFGNTVCVSLEYTEGQLIVYFPTDGQLSEEFCAQHNLVRRKDDSGNNVGGYMDASKRNVTAIRLRGEKSDGLAMDISCLEYTGVDMSTLKEGTAFTVINGHEICQKYIPRRNPRGQSCSVGNRTRKKKVPIAPLFAEHSDTEQLAYNLSAFKPGDEIEITLKMHGTSQRTAYLPILQFYRRTFWDRLFRREGTPVYDYGYVSGTRRTVLENYEGGYYGDNAFREQHSKIFEGKLPMGFTVYYEVVGFTNSGSPIMGVGNNKKLGKDFVATFGETTTFSYGCSPSGTKTLYGNDDIGAFAIEQPIPQSDMYVYRITSTNSEGTVIELSPFQIRMYCEMWGVKNVPLLWKGNIPSEEELMAQGYNSAGEWVQEKAEEVMPYVDPIGKTHIAEGVVVRIVNRLKFTAYKTKLFEFKVLEGIIKETAETPDIEEEQEIL